MGGLKQPVAQRPPNKRARGADDEEERFWNQKRKQGAAGKGRAEDGKRAEVARSAEAEFFSKCRNRMPRPLYLELLKCLNLYSQQIIDRSELLTLVHDLFKRSQPDLFTAFRRLLGYQGQGGEINRDEPSPPAATQPPTAEGGNFRDLDFAQMRRHGTSYRILPDTYIVPPCSGRGPLETLVLNDSWVSVATGTEDLNFKTMRKNQYEESIFRAEDERFELDTTIETNMATIQALTPIAAEIAALTEQEKRRYKLPSPLTAMHQKAIRRLYGSQGSQVIELLQKCPAAAVGALMKRLQQKDEEWRALRSTCAKSWKETYEKNFTKSLDHRSFYFKQGDKKNFSGKQMVLELKGLVEQDEETDPVKAAQAAAAAANASRSAEESAVLVTGTGSLSLPLDVRYAPLETLHNDSLDLMCFAAKLNFSVFEGEVDAKLRAFWKSFVRVFFAFDGLKIDPSAASATPLPKMKAPEGEEDDEKEGGDAKAESEAMEVEEEPAAPAGVKPLFVAAAGAGEAGDARRAPEQRYDCRRRTRRRAPALHWQLAFLHFRAAVPRDHHAARRRARHGGEGVQVGGRREGADGEAEAEAANGVVGGGGLGGGGCRVERAGGEGAAARQPQEGVQRRPLCRLPDVPAPAHRGQDGGGDLRGRAAHAARHERLPPLHAAQDHLAGAQAAADDPRRGDEPKPPRPLPL